MEGSEAFRCARTSFCAGESGKQRRFGEAVFSRWNDAMPRYAVRLIFETAPYLFWNERRDQPPSIWGAGREKAARSDRTVVWIHAYSVQCQGTDRPPKPHRMVRIKGNRTVPEKIFPHHHRRALQPRHSRVSLAKILPGSIEKCEMDRNVLWGNSRAAQAAMDH